MGGEKFGEFIILGPSIDQVVAFVDDNCVPLLVLEVMFVSRRVLQGVDGDDDTPVVAERIALTRERLPDLLDPRRVETDQGYCEPRPQLALELLEYGTGRNDQDAFTPTAAD